MDLEKTISDSIKNIGYELIECEHNHNNGLIRIFIDNGQMISVEDCVKVSNHLNTVLSVELDYEFSRLEVSSPGVDRKLLTLNDFTRFKGENVKVKVFTPIENVKKFEGKLLNSDESFIRIQSEDNKIVELPFDDIQLARLNPDL
jgi:ribosome maturation factor RimP